MSQVSFSSAPTTNTLRDQEPPIAIPSGSPKQHSNHSDKESDAPAKVVNVTLLLSGGHEYDLILTADSPPLRQLFSLLLEAPEKRAKRLFQLPIHQNEPSDAEDAALCFTGDRVVGIVTNPPVYIQQPEVTSPSHVTAPTEGQGSISHENGGAIASDAPIALTTAQSARYTVVASPEREQSLGEGVLPSRYIQLTNFLDAATHQRLLDYTYKHQNQFVGSSTSTGDIDYRQSLVLHHFPEFANMMQREIHAAFADVTTALQIEPFNINQVEAQLTAHNDGNFYKIHNDNGSPDTATRVLTYVYYFYQEPKPFSDGELRIYDSRVENNFYVQASSFQDVTPINNSIVFFPSYYMHEVLPIICPSKQFAHSRFTINGWVRR